MVLAMSLVALGLSIRQTIAIGTSVGESVASGPIMLQSLLAAAVLAVGISLIWSAYRRRRPPFTKGNFEILQPLRRLLSTVWS
jgi:hypothetical protein